jgi:hypothetical protein
VLLYVIYRAFVIRPESLTYIVLFVGVIAIRDGLVVACSSAQAALKRTAARGCSNFNDLRKAAAGRAVTTLEFYKGPFCCGPAI